MAELSLDDKAAHRSEALAQASKSLRARDVRTRLGAIAALERLGPPEAAPLLIGALKDRLSYVGAMAARVLGKMLTPEIADQFIAHFNWACEDGPARDGGCDVRGEIAVILGNADFRRAEPIFLRGIRTQQIEVVAGVREDTAVGLRANCAIALAQVRSGDALRELSLLLFDAGMADPFPANTIPARRAAAQVLGALGDRAAAIPLIIRLRAFPDDHPNVLVQCMNSLIAVDDQHALEVIRPFLLSETWLLAAGAATSIAQLHTAEALECLAAALDKAPAELAEAFAVSIAGTRLQAARSVLLARLESPLEPMRLAVTKALAVFGDTEVQDVLRLRAERDPSQAVRAAARESLGEAVNGQEPKA
jgi:HEAT repeat protein